MTVKLTKIKEFSYNLPDNKIAKYPLKQRDRSKLLIYDKGNISDTVFCDIPDLFSEKDLIIFNDTKVIQARLFFKKPTGAKIEIFCLEPVSPSDYSLVFQENKTCIWKCLTGNAKKWKNEILTSNLTIENKSVLLTAKKPVSAKDTQEIEFTWDNPSITFSDILESAGKTPIPPYLKRASEISDKSDYQTVYSRYKGSVAAPTAGLHFTDATLKRLSEKQVTLNHITLHVGAGTFKPVKSEIIGDHNMHTEHFSIHKDLILKLIKHSGSVTATGTTTLRTLESLYWLGVKIIMGILKEHVHISQWECYSLTNNISVHDSLSALYEFICSTNKDSIKASTQIIIVPGYTFKIVDQLITNFHQPRSTLLLLIAAFIGNDWEKIYEYALLNDFRFLSYGDSSILIPK